MKNKKLLEKRATLVSALEKAISEKNEANFKATEAEIRELDKELNKKTEKEGEKDVNKEIREALIASEGIEIREGEITTANSTVEYKEFLPGLLKKVEYISPLYAHINKIKTASTATITVQGAKIGKFVKTAELAEYTKKQASYSPKDLKADKYALAVVISDEMLEDAHFDIEADIKEQIAEGLAQTLNELICTDLNGATGAKKITGALTIDNLLAMYNAMPRHARVGATWVINTETELALSQLKDSTGQPLLVRTYQETPVVYLLGCPVIVEDGITSPMLVNLNRSLLCGIRRVFNVKRDDSVGFFNGSVAFRSDIRLGTLLLDEEVIVKLVATAKSK